MKYKSLTLVMVILASPILLTFCSRNDDGARETKENPALIAEGRNIFRYDTFGDEEFWSGLLHIDKAILGKSQGGFGAGVSPKTALSVGLKVDADALPSEVVAAIKAGSVNLDDPATTVALLKLNAVVV
jgi:hypothetical protein